MGFNSGFKGLIPYNTRLRIRGRTKIFGNGNHEETLDVSESEIQIKDSHSAKFLLSIRTIQSATQEPFLDAFAKLRKAIIGFVMCVCPSVRVEQLGSHSMDFHKIYGLQYFLALLFLIGRVWVRWDVRLAFLGRI